ncbi:MAG TPA: CAP domain-containing protein [Gemmatimonadaceae bacterium]|nr:CAP domain-containing protein [Gemmatimonadaceae bacterium]
MNKLAVATAIFALACVRPVAEPPSPARPTASQPMSATESAIVNAINDEREQRGLRPVTWDPRLDQAAKLQARNMAALRRMAHNLPETAQPTLVARVRAAGYAYRRITENIAFGQRDAETVVESWMNSPGHRANILDPNVSETGIGVTRSENGRLYFCQVFGARP